MAEFGNCFDVVYISYAQNDVQNPHVADIVFCFIDLFKRLNIQYRIDVENTTKSVFDFISEFENAKIVIIVMSDKYFRSSNCMIEWVNIHRHINSSKVILYIKYDEEQILLNNGVVLSNGFDLDNADYLSFLNAIWKEKKTKCSNAYSSDILNRNAKDGFYLSVFPKICSLMRTTVCYKTSILHTAFDNHEYNHHDIKQILSLISSAKLTDYNTHY